MIARMGMDRYKYVGQDGIRGIYSQPGSFNDAAFVASGDNLWRVDKNGTKTLIGAIGSPSPNSAIAFAATAISVRRPHICSWRRRGAHALHGKRLRERHRYGLPANNDVIQIGGIYYKFTNAGVNAGAPAGTLAIRGWWPWACRHDCMDEFFRCCRKRGLRGRNTALRSPRM
jgi:hypothetical protein